MHVTPLAWGITIVVILGLFVFDFFAHVRTPHAPTFRESAFWSTVYISIAIVFGLVVMWIWGTTYGGEYFAGYVTEKALSVDNLFVFVIIMSTFAVPREFQQKVLLIGIVLALVMRGIFIGVGAAAINAYSWVFYLFGAFLIYTAYTLIRDHGHEKEAEEKRDSRIISLVKRVLPTTEEYDGDKLITRIDGKRVVTPLLLALIAIGFADVALRARFDSGDLRSDPGTVSGVHRQRLRADGSTAAVLPDRWVARTAGLSLVRALDNPGVHRCEIGTSRVAREHPLVRQRR